MLALALAAFVSGAWWLQQLPQLPSVAWLVAGAAAGLSLTVGAVVTRRPPVTGHRSRLLMVLLAVGTTALGFTYAALRAHVRMADELRFEDEGRDLRVLGTIDSLPARLLRGARFEFAIEQVLAPAVRVPERIALAWYGQHVDVRPGERWELTVRLRRPHGAMNPGGFDFEAWMLERNLRASGYVRDGARDETPRLVADMVWTPGAMVDRARHVLRDRLERRLQGSRYAGVIVALVLGDQRAIGEDDWSLFNRTGIAHLVSISGLHITMVAGLVALAAGQAWRRSRRLLAWAPAQTAAAVIAMIAAFLYCLLAGWGVPAQRTFFMLAVVAIALLARIGTRPALTLALAAFVVCVLDPWAVLAAGFWLSFGAVAAILLTVSGRPAFARHGWRVRLAAAARVQLAVTIALVPLTIALFQQVSVVSPLANAIAIPVVSLAVTPLALAGAFFVWLPEPLAAFAVPFLALAHWLMALLAEGLRHAIDFPWTSISIAAPPPWALVLAIAGVVWLLMPRGWPLRASGALWLLPLFLWPSARPAAGEIWMTALDIGQGMAVLVETADERRTYALLYDTGPRYLGQADAGGRLILPYLRWRGIDHLDWLVVSHLDSDHSGGAASILRGTSVARVLTSVDRSHAMLVGARAVQRCEAGQAFTLGVAAVRVLHPATNDYESGNRSTNAMSCVIELRAPAARLLLTGDIPAAEEAALIARTPDVRATLASAPHHGSRHSSSADFVAAVASKWVVFQSGYRNRFGHPDAQVVKRWRDAGAKAVRTDAAGAVTWEFAADGSASVVAWREAQARYWHNQPRLETKVDDAAIERDDDSTVAPAPVEAVRPTE